MTSTTAALRHDQARALLGELRTIIERAATDGELSIAYETWLWIATRR